MPRTPSRPSLKQLFIGFLILLGRSFAEAQWNAIDIRPLHKKYNHHQQAGLLLENDLEATRCEQRDDEFFQLDSNRFSLDEFETALSTSGDIIQVVDLLGKYADLLEVCNSQGENFLHYLVNSSDRNFLEGLAIAKSRHLFHKTDSGLSLMDVLIQRNDIQKIRYLLLMVEPNVEAVEVCLELTNFFMVVGNSDISIQRKLHECALIKDTQPRSNMGKQLKAYLVKKIQKEDPALDAALLDYDVITRNFDAATQQLTSAHPAWYQSAIHRYTKNYLSFAKIEKMTLIESLRALQSLPQQIPLMHPIIRKDLNLSIAFECLIYRIEPIHGFEVADEIGKLLKKNQETIDLVNVNNIKHICKEL